MAITLFFLKKKKNQYKGVVDRCSSVTLLKNWFSLSQQLSTANSRLDMGEDLCPLFLLCAGISSHTSLVKFMHATTVSVSLYVPCCVWMILFPCSHLLPLALIIFLPPFLHSSLRLQRKGLEFSKVSQSLFLSFSLFSEHCLVVGPCVTYHWVQGNSFLMEVEWCTNL